MKSPDILDSHEGNARGDAPADAGRSLRGILHDRALYERMTSVLYWAVVAVVGAVIGMVVAVVMGHALLAAWIGGGALALAMSVRYLAATQGASALVLSSVVAAASTVAAGVAVEIPWWGTLIALAAIGVTLIPVNRTRTKLPAGPIAMAGQWATVGLMLLGHWISVAAPIAALALCMVLVQLVIDKEGDRRVERAKHRSQIVAVPRSPEQMSIGMRVPPAMSLRNIEVGVEAEQETAKELAELGPEYVVLHSRKIPHSDADLDHLVIGPHGVALVDSKYRAGEMTYSELDFQAVDDSVVPAQQQATAEEGSEKLAPLQDAAVDAAAEIKESATQGLPDEALSKEALEARQRAYEVFRVAEFAGTPKRVGEWYVNGYPASAALASSTSWEASKIEEALKMPGGTTIPVLLSIYGARMDRESATIPLFDPAGMYERDATVCHVRGIAETIRQLPAVITEQTKIDDLAIVVDDLFPRYR